MKHLRSDYDRIQDPEGKIGQDEPVFLIRGKDAAAVGAIMAWATEAEKLGANPSHCFAVRLFANYVEWWQEKNGSKVPDCPPDVLRPELQIRFGTCPGGSC